MTDDYTPTTVDVEARWISGRSVRFSRKAFRRWLSAHDAEVSASVLAEQGEPEWEFGVEYEISNTDSVFTAAHSEAMARKWVEESPTDTGLRRRRKAGPWEPVEENGENA